MVMGTQFIIPVTTTPFATLLAASGIAGWLDNLGKQLEGENFRVWLANRGAAFLVSSNIALQPEQIRVEHYQNPTFDWIKTAKNNNVPGTAAQINYEEERRHNAAYYEQIKMYRQNGTPINKLPTEQKNELESMAPHAFWPVVAMVNQMSALTTYNKAIQRWLECKPIYSELAALIWTMCSGQTDALIQAEQEWASIAKAHGLEKIVNLPATQIVNPEQGKGANRTKADDLTIGGQDSFWLLEYFKFAGLYEAAFPRTVQGKKDRKTYVVVPASDGIERRWYSGIFKEFQKDFWANSAIKMDILAVLRYTIAMLKHWEGAHSSIGRVRRPSDFVEGFFVASYKDLGSAFAVMNVATLGLPDWIPWPKTIDEAMAISTLLVAHQQMIAMMDEKKGEEEQLLRFYRDFLSSRDPMLKAFFQFTTGYASYIIHRIRKGLYTYRLTISDIEKIIYAQEETRMIKLKPITENKGFRNIATAIRQSTTQLMFYNTKKNENLYEVRYGLANELERHSRSDQDFMRALNSFLTEYSKENDRVMKREADKKQIYRRRIMITTEDINQLIELVDEYHAPTIASMLIAFGYAHDPKVKDDQPADALDSAHIDDEMLDDQDSDDRF